MRKRKKGSLVSKGRRKKRKRALPIRVRKKKRLRDDSEEDAQLTVPTDMTTSEQFPNFYDCFPPAWHKLDRHEQFRLISKRKPRVVHPKQIETMLKINNITVSHKLQSRLPYSKSTTAEYRLQSYHSDFIYRLLFDTPIMIRVAFFSQAGIPFKDKCLSDRDNRLQFELFNSYGRVTRKGLEFPKEYQNKPEEEELDNLVIRLTECARNAKSTYMFRYEILKAFWTTPSIRKKIALMIPKHKYYVLYNILKRTFITETSLNREGRLANTDRTFNEILELVWYIGNRYDSNYGIEIHSNGKIMNIFTYQEANLTLEEVIGKNNEIIVNEDRPEEEENPT